MASRASTRSHLSITALVVLIACVAIVGFVLWSGRGVLESQQSSASEWLTVSASAYEFRGTAYPNVEALYAGLQALEPKPRFVSVRWLTSGAPDSSAHLVAEQVRQVLDAMARAQIPTSETVVGNEVFVGKP